jgi:2-oxoglutarate ferredoxin oxidoreductase subunit beta
MTSIPKPKVHHPGLPTNALGLTRRDYEGSMSTLCAGCGHDSVTAAIIQAFWEMDIPPHRVAKLSGIGCSAKTPAYFVGGAHGFNGVHGRMPALATGANAANRQLVYIGISGDGDSLSIGLGQFCHAIRRNVDLLYVLENNGVYGLTKGQFSASADVGSKSKRGVPNIQRPIDPALTALSLGCSFVARSFSGDKEELVPILEAGLAHRGFAFVDVISPCVTFNDHVGSTKSYRFTREHSLEVAPVDFVPLKGEITTETEGDQDVRVITMHDGSMVRFRRVAQDYDPTDRDAAYAHVRRLQEQGEVATGLLYLEQGLPDMHATNDTVEEPLVELPFEALCPGGDALADLMTEFR